MTGYGEEELVGQSPRILQGPGTDRKVIEELSRKIRAGEFFEGSTVNYRKDGVSYVVQWNISPVRDADGAITGYISVQQDITARLAAERERGLLAEALNAATDPVIVMDSDFVIVFANSAFGREVGRPVADLLGGRRSSCGRRPRGPGRPQIRRALAEGSSYRGAVFFDLAARRSAARRPPASPASSDTTTPTVTMWPLRRTSLTWSSSRWPCGKMANIDVLTGLLNRRSGQVALEVELRGLEFQGFGELGRGRRRLLQEDQRPPRARGRRRRPAVGGSVAARRYARQRLRRSLGR